MFFPIPIFIKPNEPQPMPIDNKGILIKEIFSSWMDKPKIRQCQYSYLINALNTEDEAARKAYISLSKNLEKQYEAVEKFEKNAREELSELQRKKFVWIKEN